MNIDADTTKNEKKSFLGTNNVTNANYVADLVGTCLLRAHRSARVRHTGYYNKLAVAGLFIQVRLLCIFCISPEVCPYLLTIPSGS